MIELWASLDFLKFSRYEASSSGRICNINTNNILQGSIIKGYRTVHIYDDHGKDYTKTIP